MKPIRVSAPAKIHLLGEHVVVYGKPALLAAIDRRVTVTIMPSIKKDIRGVWVYEKEIKQLLEILEREIKKRFTKEINSYVIKIESDVVIGSGLGSSAAISASLTAALLSFLGISWNKKTIFEIAYEGEKFFHGNPSGGDLAVVIEGSMVWYRKEFEFLKTIIQLPFKPHRNIEQFFLINSGKSKESTKEMVEKVAQFKKYNPQKIKALFDSQEELTRQMVTALKTGDENKLIDCIRLGERNLEKLGVVGAEAKSIIRLIENLGGAAKINGGGGIKEGSGMLLVYHQDLKKVLNYAKQSNLEVLKIKIGEEGLRRDE